MNIHRCICGGEPFRYVIGSNPTSYEYEILSGERDFQYPDSLFCIQCNACGRKIIGDYMHCTLEAWNAGEAAASGVLELSADECPYLAMELAPGAEKFLPAAEWILSEADYMLSKDDSKERYVQWRVLETTILCLTSPIVMSSTVEESIWKAVGEYIDESAWLDPGVEFPTDKYARYICNILSEECEIA